LFYTQTLNCFASRILHVLYMLYLFVLFYIMQLVFLLFRVGLNVGIGDRSCGFAM